jgi:hypothetical protein
MTIPPINPFAGMAAAGLNDRRAIQEEREQDKSQTKIEQRAVGDGEADALESAADRDADGRQNWQGGGGQPQPSPGEAPGQAATTPRHSRDPYQQRGNRLDLDG